MTDVEYIITEYPIDMENEDKQECKNLLLDQPDLDYPKLDNPILDNPNWGNPRQLNTKELNTKELNTNQSYPITSHRGPIQETKVKMERIDGSEVYYTYKEIVEKNIEYQHYRTQVANRELVTGIRDIIIEVLCTKKSYINIAGDEYPAELVKNKYLKLNYRHIEYVLECMNENTTQIRNMKKYLMATLFNAPSTINNYYNSMFNYQVKNN